MSSGQPWWIRSLPNDTAKPQLHLLHPARVGGKTPQRMHTNTHPSRAFLQPVQSFQLQECTAVVSSHVASNVSLPPLYNHIPPLHCYGCSSALPVSSGQAWLSSSTWMTPPSHCCKGGGKS